ncbi:uncharacterized protein LOC121191510 [Toxotes jaculatrix]|uniref:uncharacterized protein LOC121191510 n=1 Tax=Toxotes jaculatrix TaxID=941984 RepID=UPI001B3AD167|nr:uncharacterized protein LOC121191510 [Toxotes jaculatrix]
MSLRSGKGYLKDYAAMQQNEACGEEEVATANAATRQTPLPTLDARSQSSKASTRLSQRSSSTTSSAVKAYAKAKAAKAQLAYAEREADMMKQRAELLKQQADFDASLHLLQCQRAAAAAEAEATAYMEAEIESGELKSDPPVAEEPISTFQRTHDYIQQQSELVFREEPYSGKIDELRIPDFKPPVLQGIQNKTRPVYKNTKQEQTAIRCSSNTYLHSSPKHAIIPEKTSLPEPKDTKEDFAKYLMRREMVSAGLLQFDDKPENYWAWKTSFLSATKDLNLSAREELDLLTKWLGVESSEQAKRIRSVHILNPTAGVSMVWQRLEECYGTPEVIEDALLKKIEHFPRLTNKDNVKLRELSDILLELECAKEDGSLPGLAYLDTARGVKQIVEKLPFNLQEKWASVGSQYKEDHGVAFPPFFVFSKFVQKQARIKNDPSFTMSATNSQVPSRSEKPSQFSRKASVMVHKTDIPAESSGMQTSSVPKKLEEPDHQCPIHKKPHPLRKCKLFRGKPLEERKAYLRENRICYRCCGSVQHIAKDCKVAVECVECNSDKHITALHPDPLPATTQSAAAVKDDSGEQNGNSSSVTSKCTEVCGHNDHSHSCSKICLVKVYPAGEEERAVKMYAVLDEQSNKSLAKSEFFTLFKVKGSPTPYTLKTCSGKSETAGRRAVNFIIESMDRKLQLPLPPLIECDMVPDERTEIPSPEVARHHPHLLPVVTKIQPVDQDAQILLLLGRDILQVHKVREQINGPHNAPYAQRLDLGWVIVGEVCLGTAHKPSEINVYKTNTLHNGRTSFLKPCPNSVHVKEDYSDKAAEMPESSLFSLVEPETDNEIRREVTTLATKATQPQLGSQHFERCSSWRTLCETIARLIHVAASFKEKASNGEKKGWKSFKDTPSLKELSQAKVVIVHTVQRKAFKEDFKCLKDAKQTCWKQNVLKKLNPVVDKDGLLRVGGRLSSADLSEEEKHPLIIPRTHHIATLLVRYFHEQVAHQGRHITEGAIRAAGYWIIGSKRLVSSVIHKCVTCRKLRGRLEEQKMADLPADRLTPEPTFTTVGLDVFGPWFIMTRRTRGGSATSKRWAVLFTCMSTRAVHIELIETMSTDSFINALRRFFSIRGPAKLLRSDRGTNFVGACKELGINTDNTTVRKYLQEKGCSWVFNPPHASHMGGSWERLIGVARRILDAMLLQTGPTRLTHEVLSTFMAEVMAIMNARPLVPISTDPDNPAILTPAMLLTQKMSAVSAPSGCFEAAQLYGKQWKQVQCLADTFWKRWKGEYLATLQSRRKWTKDKPNVKEGDVVLLKDGQAQRNDWPMGLIVKVLPSSDKKVRKVEVRIVKDGTAKVLQRPISEIVVLLSETE